MTVRHGNLTVEWLGYATARIEAASGPIAYTDPGRYGVLDDYWARDGDLVVVTHDHHYDPDGIRSVAADDATVVIYENVDPDRIDRDVAPIADLAADYEVVRVDDETRVDVETGAGEITVWSVAAHNDPEGPNADANGTVTHPPGFGCGFLLDVEDHTVFWPGDSDALDGFAELDVSVFLANIGGGGIVSDRHAAAELAEAMDPDLVVPIHYDTFEQLAADGEAFAGDVASRSIPVALDERSANQ
ncbi:MBL fold metallo-hydrolase [Halorubrum sp. CBA1125]|uniref:MBL fold metallo-hydrolase n=1 Tax=Halorubrum sp. CBA1125 TaxID=2668072 RepID=UPI0012E7B8B5|nr:MBL fold metallo-hydrolase [Halorubrum sp. CBA1125]MUW15681.1 MBL fold metallo-hydrolase [Halorubrum sp. CBA1125]